MATEQSDGLSLRPEIMSSGAGLARRDRGERHILALDGGGVRGVVTLHMLDSFERHFGVRACDFFDLFAGTSTGAIIAALLAFKRLSASEILEVYRRLIPRVFPRTWKSETLLRYIVPAIYSRELALEQLNDHFGNRTLESLRDERPSDPQGILLTTHDLVRDEELFLSNYPFRAGCPNYGPTWKVRDAVAASALSAPWYFGPYEGRFIDGGVTVFNTPARQAAIEALDYCACPPFERGQTTLWSLGSGSFASGFQKWEADDWPPWSWGKRLFTDIQSDAEADQIYGAMRMRRNGEIAFRRYQVTVSRDTVADLRVETPTPDLPIELDRADALDFLDELGRRFAQQIDWSKSDGHLLRPPFADPFRDRDLWRSEEKPPLGPPRKPTERLG